MLKIIDCVKEFQFGVFFVGFKVEIGFSEEEFISVVRKQIECVGSDLVVVNIFKVFGSEENEVVLVGRDFVKKFFRMIKCELVERFWDEIEKMFQFGFIFYCLFLKCEWEVFQ